MAKRLQVSDVRPGIHYPADAETLKKVRSAGGLIKMTPEERSALNYKYVKSGDFCDDVPAISRDHLIASGKVVEVTVPAKKAAAKKAGR